MWVFFSGQKPLRSVLQPLESDSASPDPVICLEWDPLSREYLLAAWKQQGVALVDTEGDGGQPSVLMSFHLPSVACEVQCLAWIDSAPGMFITGGQTSSFVLTFKFMILSFNLSLLSLLLVFFTLSNLRVKLVCCCIGFRCSEWNLARVDGGKNNSARELQTQENR